MEVLEKFNSTHKIPTKQALKTKQNTLVNLIKPKTKEWKPEHKSEQTIKKCQKTNSATPFFRACDMHVLLPILKNRGGGGGR